MKLSEQNETPLTPAAAVAFVADFANAHHWDPGVATSPRIDDGPVRVGEYHLALSEAGLATGISQDLQIAFQKGRGIG